MAIATRRKDSEHRATVQRHARSTKGRSTDDSTVERRGVGRDHEVERPSVLAKC